MVHQGDTADTADTTMIHSPPGTGSCEEPVDHIMDPHHSTQAMAFNPPRPQSPESGTESPLREGKNVPRHGGASSIFLPMAILTDKTSAWWQRRNVLRLWWWEAICCCLVVAALIAIIVTARDYDHQPLPQWPVRMF